MSAMRVLSGMRPTGGLHLGHLRGVLGNWRKLQDDGAECFFFVADWHALTTHYAKPPDLPAATREVVLAWLAAGICGERSALFAQSHIPEHAELHVLLSMLCPLSRLTQLPTYKEMKENLSQDLDTYGFLGYPLLQSADILAYRATAVPVGEDQHPHIEFTRELARRFNRFYGGGAAFAGKAQAALAGLPKALQKRVAAGKKSYQQSGDEGDLADALQAAASAPPQAAATLRAYCLYSAEELLPPPAALLAPAARLPGTDGRKMSKSYNNAIDMFEAPEVVQQKIARMTTDPARQRRTDKGNPQNCPVWSLHAQFSDSSTREWASAGCKSAEIGCVECKKSLAEHINAELAPLRGKRRELEKQGAAEATLAQGARRARKEAAKTLAVARKAMGLRNA